METRRNRFIVEGPFKELPRLTDKYRAILLLLQRRRYLPTKTIAALVESDLSGCQKALEALRHEYGLIDARWAGTNAFYQEAVYYLTERGYDELKRRGLFTHKTPPDPEKFPHELGVNLVMASFELGAREHGIELLDRHYLLDRAPAPTRRLQEPFVIPVTITMNKKTFKTEVESDGDFFALQTDYPIIFPGFEFDRRTEPLEPEDYDRPSIRKKFIAYRQAIADEAYEKRFGFEDATYLIPFITINERHLRSMMNVLDKITNGKGSTLFIFKALPNFASYEKFPPPTGHMITEPWLRVGHPPINILEELKGTTDGSTRTSTESRRDIGADQEAREPA